MVAIYKVAAILVFPTIAVFLLNYLKLIHLQANILSYFEVNHTNLPHNFVIRA